MGNFYISCRVETVDSARGVDVSGLLVDTGSAYTWIGEKVLESLGIGRQKKDVTFVTANGQRITRSMGFAILHVAGTFTIDEVVFGEEGDLQLLGARSLEGLNLAVDSVGQKLVAAGPILAASAKDHES